MSFLIGSQAASMQVVRSTGRRFIASTSKSTDKKSLKHYSFSGHTTSNKNKNSVTITFDEGGHTIMTDLPRNMGGNDNAPQPVEYLLAAWAGCTQATALFVSRHNMQHYNSNDRYSLERLEFVNVKATRDERGALALPVDQPPPISSRIHTITGTIVIWPSLSSDKDLDWLKEQTELRCPIANMLVASGCHMNVQWVNGGSADE